MSLFKGLFHAGLSLPHVLDMNENGLHVHAHILKGLHRGLKFVQSFVGNGGIISQRTAAPRFNRAQTVAGVLDLNAVLGKVFAVLNHGVAQPNQARNR